MDLQEVEGGKGGGGGGGGGGVWGTRLSVHSFSFAASLVTLKKKDGGCETHSHRVHA